MEQHGQMWGAASSSARGLDYPGRLATSPPLGRQRHHSLGNDVPLSDELLLEYGRKAERSSTKQGATAQGQDGTKGDEDGQWEDQLKVPACSLLREFCFLPPVAFLLLFDASRLFLKIFLVAFVVVVHGPVFIKLASNPIHSALSTGGRVLARNFNC